MQDNPNRRFTVLEQAFCRCYRIIQNDEHLYYSLKT
jgi:hypothetical protein